MGAYYNEHEPFAAQWLRNLITAGHIAPGDVDERSIRDVRADDVRGYRQCHFFAGIGVWSHALRCAGWPDERSVWTGSCPCQPFSVAGSKLGTADERHLWPEFFRLIRECRPAMVLGEQVASKSALGWLDAVFDDLEGAGYACGAADTCAASVGAPHIRQRLYWVADAAPGGQRVDGGSPWDAGHAPQREPARGVEHADHDLHDEREGEDGQADEWAKSGRAEHRAGRAGAARRMGNPSGSRSGRDAGAILGAQADGARERRGARGIVDEPVVAGANGFASARDRWRFERLGRVADSNGGQPSDGDLQRGGRLVQLPQGTLAGFWAEADWLRCRPEQKYPEGRWRPVEPGTFPLAHGIAGRLGRLRAYGNALCAPQAAEFMKAVIECAQEAA